MILFYLFVCLNYALVYVYYCIYEDTWMEAGLTGDDRPPPCSRFSFNKIDSHRALMFGGKQDKYKVTYGDVYILDLDSQVL